MTLRHGRDKCEAGCLVFDGGEVKHHRDCVHYPESLTKVWHDREAELVAEIDRLRGLVKRLENLIRATQVTCEQCGNLATFADQDDWAFCSRDCMTKMIQSLD